MDVLSGGEKQRVAVLLTMALSFRLIKLYTLGLDVADGKAPLPQTSICNPR